VSKILQKVRFLLSVLRATYNKNPKKSIATAIVVCVVGLIIFIQGGNDVTAPEEQRVPNVTVNSVAVLSSETDPLVLLGEVRSVSQAELRAQRPGEVTQVYVRPGQFVKAGAILTETANQSERAAVLSAQGMLAAAKAQLQKVTAGARPEDKTSSIVQSQAAQVSLETAKQSARSAYSQAYTLAQDAIFAQADDFFSNPYTVDPSFRIRSASFDEKQVIEKERVEIAKILDRWKQSTATTISDDALDTRLMEAEKDLERIKMFLNSISSYISEQTIDADLSGATKSAQEATVLGARSNISNAQNIIHGARNGLTAAQSGSQVASLSSDVILSGARSEDVATAQAGVTQAQGALAGAYAQLENTIIRTPISGTVSTLNVARGDFVNSFDVVAVVANEGALEVEVFVSDVARARVTVGSPVLIDGQYQGMVTTVSPGLDPVTKKSRVTIGITGDAELSNGSYVEVALLDESLEKKVSEVEKNGSKFTIPISAIKVLPQGFAVFTVRDDNTLEARAITEGPILGSKMLVSEGLTPDLKIVTDVRGLSEGDVVTTYTEE
jgi:multidrug efflux pump subunit AcrA (membrane-fusion protein)